MKKAKNFLYSLLHLLNGDRAYARYLSHWRAHHPEQAPLSRREFYRSELQRKWSGINRCC